MSDLDIPIDIAIRKLLDWLVSRRICSRNWHEGVTTIREKIGEALMDMPEHQGIKELLAGSNINYFHCLKIVEILKDTEKESKNFFGSYGSQRMKDWQQIVKMYQSENIYLAEAASILSQNVVYEGPGLKKSISKCDQIEQECDKKDESIKKRIVELEEEFKKDCKELGINGKESIKKEIIGLAKDLPEIYEQLSKDAVNLADACKLYSDFVKSMSNNEVVVGEIVGNLQFFIDNGNVSTYEWKYREKPLSIVETELTFNDDEEANGTDGDAIDFGEQDGDSGEIDFGDEAAEIDFGEDQIDFGDEIDFGDTNEIDYGDVEFDTSAIVVEEGGLAGGIAKDEEALSLLDNRRTRSYVIDELEELSCFLSQRLAEATSSGFKYNLVSEGLDHDPEILREMLKNVDALLGKLNEPKMKQLQLIRSSPEVVDRLVERLKTKLKLAEKVKSGHQDTDRRRQLSAKDRIQASKQLAVVSSRTKELQAHLENDISKRYNGRRVNIMGVAI